VKNYKSYYDYLVGMGEGSLGLEIWLECLRLGSGEMLYVMGLNGYEKGYMESFKGFYDELEMRVKLCGIDMEKLVIEDFFWILYGVLRDTGFADMGRYENGDMLDGFLGYLRHELLKRL